MKLDEIIFNKIKEGKEYTKENQISKKQNNEDIIAKNEEWANKRRDQIKKYEKLGKQKVAEVDQKIQIRDELSIDPRQFQYRVVVKSPQVNYI